MSQTGAEWGLCFPGVRNGEEGVGDRKQTDEPREGGLTADSNISLEENGVCRR